MKQNNTADLQTYSKAWYDKMVEIWRDRIDAMNILDTGALRGSVAGKGFAIDEMGGQMAFQFLQYGIFVDLGTGKGYKRGNGGDLKLLFVTGLWLGWAKNGEAAVQGISIYRVT